MNLRQAVVQELAGNAGVASKVGAAVFPDVAPPGTESPWVVVIRSPGRRFDTHDKGKAMVENRVSVTAWSNDADEAAAIASAVVDCLKWKSGTIGGVGGVAVQGISLEGDYSVHDTFGMYGEVRDFQIMYQEVD